MCFIAHGKENKMKQKFIMGTQIVLLTLVLALIGAGCNTSSTVSTKAKILKPKVGANVDLSKYQIATVQPFVQAEGIKKPIEPSVGINFADGVASRLQSDFGPIFSEVRKGNAFGNADELIVTGVIREYTPGDKFARAMCAGLGAAGFKGDLILKDGATNSILFSAPFDKLWAWGGMMGASKGIEEMVTESQAAVATTVAQAKGWKPPPKPSKTKTSKAK
jgi:hypothetical protein